MARKKNQADPGATSAAQQSTPKKRRWYHNVADAYRLVVKAKPAFRWMLWGTILGVLALFVVIGVLVGHPVYLGILGLLVAALAAMSLLAFQTRKTAYAQIEGQPGAAGAVLGEIRRGWSVEREPVAVNPRTQDLVYRVVGRPGVVLVSEGPGHRVARMLKDEERKVARVAQNTPVHHVQVGRDEGQVPLTRLERHLRRLPKKLTTAEVAEVAHRLRALPSTKMPIPKGIDPMRARPDRKGMRGR